MKFLLAEFFIVLILVSVFIFFFKKRFTKGILIGLSLIVMLLGILAGNLVNLIPIPTEPVILTALNDKNEESTYTQVAICRIVVDNKEYQQINPSKGKWFWRGDELWWRPNSDSRRPDGLTQTIVIDVPIGNSRIIEFASYFNRGILKVESGDKCEIIDTYVTKGSDNVSAVLTSTAEYKLILFKLFKLAIFALIIVIFAFYPIFALNKFGNERVKNWFGRNWDKVYYFIISIMYVSVLQSVSDEGSFWCDEVWQLGWMYTGYPKGETMILNPIINKFWFNIMPYGQEYLRLLPQLFVAGSIFTCGLAGSEYKNKRFGILLSSSIAFSLTIINQCGMCIRGYALLLLCSSLMLFMYIKKQKYIGNEKIHLLILYGLSATVTMDVHQFGLVTAGLFLISDFILLSFKKASKKAWIEFLIPVIYGVYWLINSLNFYVSSGFSTWLDNANPSRLFDAVQWLFCYNDILLAFFVFGIVIIMFTSIYKIYYKKFNFTNDFTILTITTVPVILILITYFYSTVINPDNSLLVDRYFISIIVCMYFVMCYGIDKIIDYIVAIARKKTIEQVLVISSVCLMCLYNWPQVSSWDKWERSYRTANTDFKSSIEYVMNQSDAYDKETLYIMDIHNAYGGIGIEYYITHKGERDDINHCSIVDIPKNFDDYSIIYISYVYKGNRYNRELNEIIDSEFELVSDDETAKVKKYIRISL